MVNLYGIFYRKIRILFFLLKTPLLTHCHQGVILACILLRSTQKKTFVGNNYISRYLNQESILLPNMSLGTGLQHSTSDIIK